MVPCSSRASVSSVPSLRMPYSRGRHAQDLDMGVVIELLFGSLMARLLAGATIDDPYLDRVFDAVWASIGGTKV